MCLWIFRDAKKHGVDATLWTVIAVFTSFIGLILYFVVGRKQNKTKCPNCYNGVDPTLHYCSACGTPISPETIVGYNVYGVDSQKAVKPMKTAFFISLVLCVVTVIAWCVIMVNVAANGTHYNWKWQSNSNNTLKVENLLNRNFPMQFM